MKNDIVKKISIIVPIYNSEIYLKKMLDSLVNQTLKEIEIILINDGSKDNSLKICNEYLKNDNRIKIIDKKNEGVSIARNEGINVSSGKYLLFVDADDWIENNMCEILYNSIEKYDADIIFCNHIIESYNNKESVSINNTEKVIIGNEIKNKIILPIIEEDNVDKIHKLASFRGPWGKLYKKSIIDENYIKFDENLIIGEDFIFNLEYLKQCNKAVIEKSYLYHYRINTNSAINRYKENAWIIYKNLLIRLEEYLFNNFKTEEYIYRLNKLKIKYLLICLNNETNAMNKKSLLNKLKNIKSICEDKIINKELINFRVKSINLKEKLILFLMRKKMYLIYIMYKSIFN